MSAPTGASAGPAWQVRAVEPAQAERLSGLMRQCFLAAYAQASSADNVQAHLQRHYTPQRQAQELADPGLLSLVLERNAAWAGFAQLRCGGAPGEGAQPGDAEVARFYLLPVFHGSGLAAQLMQALREAARARGAGGLWLSVWQRAKQAQRFYAKQGFQRVGKAVFRMGEDAQDDWILRAPL